MITGALAPIPNHEGKGHLQSYLVQGVEGVISGRSLWNRAIISTGNCFSRLTCEIFVAQVRILILLGTHVLLLALF